MYRLPVSVGFIYNALSKPATSNLPGRIVIADVAELRLYGFRGNDGLLAELLGILEKTGGRFAQDGNARCAAVVSPT